MGFSGHPVFARSPRPPAAAPVFAGLGPEPGDAVHAGEPRPGGWQTLELTHGLWSDDDLPALVARTGAPVCVADVSDSGVALVTGLGPGGRRRRAWLNLDNAAALLTEKPEDVDDTGLWIGNPEFDEAVRRKRAELDADVPADAAGALAWAAAERTWIKELLRAHEPFVEDLFDGLLDALGFPRTAQSSPEA
ncbi:hypothetical protein [Streptomyces sp. NPDC006610]|uniref:hypothetical protein n=1 Tax=Streptomyces sp. NPDC006610 TaxID=3154584 RepID=UPI0033A94226